MRKAMLGLIASVIVLLSFSSGGFAMTYNAGADFSLAQNPNGVWAYGWMERSYNNLGGFNLFTRSDPATNSWGHSSAISFGSGLQLVAGWGEAAVLRFTAPVSGGYSFSGVFDGAAFSDVGILQGTSWIWQGPFATLRPFSFSDYFISKGESIDFIVSRTSLSKVKLDLSISTPASPVPVPAAALLFITGLLGVAGARARSKR
ncbi:MAG: VPLPA-CTERM sorting domain-containing protein [Pseudomonadota bacterium]|nr:VPLPA-CTERM sorting domain-containing protein [Pseudomonadota bacterium]